MFPLGHISMSFPFGYLSEFISCVRYICWSPSLGRVALCSRCAVELGPVVYSQCSPELDAGVFLV